MRSKNGRRDTSVISDQRTRSAQENINPGFYVFLRKDYANPDKEKKHKLGPIATGLYPVREVEGYTFVFEYEDFPQERVSRDRVEVAPSTSGEILSDTPVRAEP